MLFKINNSLKRIFFQKRNIICRVGFVRIQSGREKGDDEGQMKTCRLEVYHRYVCGTVLTLKNSSLRGSKNVNYRTDSYKVYGTNLFFKEQQNGQWPTTYVLLVVITSIVASIIHSSCFLTTIIESQYYSYHGSKR